jgi:thiamine pyrophosphate-dependent acetolactate synthase large subunit-like protein
MKGLRRSQPPHTPSSPAGRLPVSPPPEETLSQAVDLLKKAKRPVIVVGHGARFNMQKVIAFAEKFDIPVITTFKGKGLIPDSHPLACGVLGRSGTAVASWFMNEADLMVVFGASFSSHTGIAKKKTIIQVDFDPMQLGKFHSVNVPVWGEIGMAVDIFADQLKGKTKYSDQKAELAERWKIWRDEKQRRELDDLGKGLNSASIFASMNRLIPENAVIAVDVGNNTYSFGRYFECSAQAVLMSGYLGSIGFGFPAAMGAWAAAPDRPIIAVTGDGGFGQYMGELTTAVKYNMNITHILLNNNELGKITKEQKAGKFDVWETNLHNPDFSKYAEICGALGIRVTEKSQLDAAISQALAHDGPAMVEIMADAELV